MAAKCIQRSAVGANPDQGYFRQSDCVAAGREGAADQIATADGEREKLLAQYKTADANISDYLVEKERIESYLQIFVVVLFALGTLLTAFGRMMEMREG